MKQTIGIAKLGCLRKKERECVRDRGREGERERERVKTQLFFPTNRNSDSASSSRISRSLFSSCLTSFGVGTVVCAATGTGTGGGCCGVRDVEENTLSEWLVYVVTFSNGVVYVVTSPNGSVYVDTSPNGLVLGYWMGESTEDGGEETGRDTVLLMLPSECEARVSAISVGSSVSAGAAAV